MILTSRPGLLVNLLLWLAVTVFGVYLLSHVKNFINFGIDLVGGTYLTLDVKIEEAYKHELMTISDEFIEKLKAEKLSVPKSPKISADGEEADLEFESLADAKAAFEILKQLPNITHRHQEQKFTHSLKGNIIKVTLTKPFLSDIKSEAVENNISILRTRLDVYGAGEITIYPQGDRTIVVELPNVSDPEQAKERIGKSALLEMKPIYDSASTQEKLLDKLGGEVPEGSIIVPGKPGSERGYFLVPAYTKLSGRLLKDATYDFSPAGFLESKRTPHVVSFRFNNEGEDLFYELTKENIGGNIAIIIDNQVISAPGVSKPIEPGGGAMISGGFTEESAKELATLLKSGAYAAPVEFSSERSIGPSLGNESIKKGLMSCAIGLGLLLLFSLLIYKTSGLFAFIVLLYNLLLILFGLAFIPNATLTLPGIAGMVLTVGMAIDSSILIYERIKEELAAGVPLRTAINAGFSGATSVILDANITTFIVGAVLYYFGSPAIQGFALTMMIGIISTLITGLLMLKWLFNFSLDILGFKKISF